MLTSYADDEALFSAILAGASGYVLKQIKGSDLVSAVRRVAAGESLLDPSLTRQVMERLRGENVEDERLARLTAQERNILELIADGKTNRQIADELFLAEKTVKNYVSNLLSKMGFARRTEAAVYARGPGRAQTQVLTVLTVRAGTRPTFPGTLWSGRQPDVHDDMHDLRGAAERPGKARVAKDVEHPGVLRQRVGDQPPDAVCSGCVGQVLQEDGGEPVSLEGVVDDERHFGLVAVRRPVVAGHRHDLGPVLRHERNDGRPRPRR